MLAVLGTVISLKSVDDGDELIGMDDMWTTTRRSAGFLKLPVRSGVPTYSSTGILAQP